MRAFRPGFFTSRYHSGWTSLVLGLAILITPLCIMAQEYEGAEYCAGCHEEQYSEWKSSGHPHIFMEAQNAKYRPIPLPDGQAWDDISYVVGGHRWRALYLDDSGNLITSGQSQYNILTGEWSTYQADGTPEADCGSCHTTNWVAGAGPLPGIGGTFAFPGVECEECHGPGFGSMNKDESAELCGQCHIRGNSDSIAASGGFIRHNSQYNEFLASPMSDMNCVDCHNPHKSARVGIVKTCESAGCHAAEGAAFANNPMSDYGVECIDCHMPYASLSSPGQQLGPNKGDIRTHIFKINTDPAASMFSQDGNSVVLTGGKGAVTLNFACKRCHQTANVNELAKFAKNFHNQSFADIGMNAGLSGNWWGGLSRDGEGFFLDFGYSGGALTLFAAFFTYDDMGNQAWVIALGPADTGTTATVDIYIGEGRMWGADFDPADGSTEVWGTGTFTFTSCTTATVSLMPNQTYRDLGFTDLSYDLQRDLLVPGIQCPSFANNTQ